MKRADDLALPDDAISQRSLAVRTGRFGGEYLTASAMEHCNRQQTSLENPSFAWRNRCHFPQPNNPAEFVHDHHWTPPAGTSSVNCSGCTGDAPSSHGSLNDAEARSISASSLSQIPSLSPMSTCCTVSIPSRSTKS